MNLKSALPQEIFELGILFKKYNIDLFLVGGSIRDLFALSNKKLDCDFDFATSAKSQQICEILSGYKIYKIGEKFGSIQVKFKGIQAEITTFRKDLNYIDNRHPKSVEFVGDINCDLARRDFTINALAYDILGNKLIDNFNGILDIKRKMITCVGVPNMRFSEDSLRILRAFSLASKLDFNIEDSTMIAIKECKNLIYRVSVERILSEIFKILAGKNPYAALKIMHKLEILNAKIPPKNLNKIPINIRKYALFLLFSDLFFVNKTLIKKLKIIEQIYYINFPKSHAQARIKLANLSLKFDIALIKIALVLQQKLHKKRIKFPKKFEQKLNIDGNLLQNIGIYDRKISQIKAQLLFEVRTKMLKNSKKHLLNRAKNLQKTSLK